jgi:Ca-activated chloride channel family protein
MSRTSNLVHNQGFIVLLVAGGLVGALALSLIVFFVAQGHVPDLDQGGLPGGDAWAEQGKPGLGRWGLPGQFGGNFEDLDPNEWRGMSAPVPFHGDGKIKGWKVTFPGRPPLATAAVAGGKVFLGGGFGSNTFYALDAATGQRLWHHMTGDDGPTAAVVEDDYIAFNTESCELEVLTSDGQRVWKKWLGDPLMSMPAAANGKVYAAFPDMQRGNQHFLACFDLRSGREFWRAPIAGDVITAPTLAEGRVFLATLEGSLYCLNQDDGRQLWCDRANATSSPLVWNGHCYFGSRQEAPGGQAGNAARRQTERLIRRSTQTDGSAFGYDATVRAADYLDYAKRSNSSASEAEARQRDAGVGFSQAPPAAKLGQAMGNLGLGSVAGVWSYQGSRPFVAEGRLFSSMGDTLSSVDPQTGQSHWTRAFAAKGPLLDSVLTPPALVNGRVFLGTAAGEVVCLSAATGAELWKVNVGEPVVAQPAVAGGRVYVSTNRGSLICLETGDPGDDGWPMWGGNAAHNGWAR